MSSFLEFQWKLIKFPVPILYTYLDTLRFTIVQFVEVIVIIAR